MWIHQLLKTTSAPTLTRKCMLFLNPPDLNSSKILPTTSVLDLSLTGLRYLPIVYTVYARRLMAQGLFLCVASISKDILPSLSKHNCNLCGCSFGIDMWLTMKETGTGEEITKIAVLQNSSFEHATRFRRVDPINLAERGYWHLLECKNSRNTSTCTMTCLNERTFQLHWMPIDVAESAKEDPQPNTQAYRTTSLNISTSLLVLCSS